VVVLVMAVVTTAFLLSARLDEVPAEVERVAMPLARLLSDSNSSTVTFTVGAGALPVVMFLMKLGRTLTSPPSTSPLPA